MFNKNTNLLTEVIAVHAAFLPLIYSPLQFYSRSISPLLPPSQPPLAVIFLVHASFMLSHTQTRPLSHTSVALHISDMELWSQRRPCRGLRHHRRTELPHTASPRLSLSLPLPLSLSYPSRVVPSNSRAPVARCMKTQKLLSFFLCCFLFLFFFFWKKHKILAHFLLCVIQLQDMVH